MPNLINPYNKHMVGVNHLDWLVGHYSINIRGEKVVLPLLIRSLDMAAINPFTIHKNFNKDEVLNLKQFRGAVTTIYPKEL
ncbi:hypothetical protein TNCV_1412981 [Trichonephila clavipes]|nr:hypothetical protein TNCV_1412981 [Trichonephila clavipes]